MSQQPPKFNYKNLVLIVEQLIYVTNTVKGWLITSSVHSLFQFIWLRWEHILYTFP